jgi:hypothetical protein
MDGKIVLDSIRMALRKIEWKGVDWMHWFRIEPVVRSCEHANESSISIRGGEFLECLSDSSFPKKDSSSCG